MRTVPFYEKKNCCACGACENICPQNAISMETDEEGFLYPNINNEKCIECGACTTACTYQNVELSHIPLQAFVAVNKTKDQLRYSASGGVFSAIATMVLNEGGIVFGATLDFEDGYAKPQHIAINQVEHLPRLQGSKYVQSKIGNTFKQARDYLIQGRRVLFSGTPCQISGLYGYLKKNYENLITIDVICHGIPNEKLFNDYLQMEKKRIKAQTVINYSFRDKKKGWGINERIDFIYYLGEQKSIYRPGRLTSYNTLFLDGIIYRENCYSCPYAQRKRVSDLTIGDFWGIENEHSELLWKKGYDKMKGISCLLVNTEKGCYICERMHENLQMEVSTLEKVSCKNGQLNKPSVESPQRKFVLNLYVEKGYGEVEKWFEKHYRKQIFFYTIYNSLPCIVLLKVKMIILRLKLYYNCVIVHRKKILINKILRSHLIK